MKQRETNIEVYRILLILGICLLHGFSQGAYVYLVGTCNLMPWVACVISAFAVFALGIVLDIPRRVVWPLIFKPKV